MNFKGTKARRHAGTKGLMWLGVMLLVVMPAGVRAEAQGGQEGTKFLRFVEDERGGGRLEAAVVTYRNADGANVRLVSAVHVADGAYYRKLNELFAEQEAVLYEMIKPAGAAPPGPGAGAGAGGEAAGMIAGLQRVLKLLLDLEFQLDAIDYTPAHFVHADLDVETFFRLQRERGESLLTLMLNAMLTELARGREGRAAPEVTFTELMLALQAPDRPRQLKLLLARQFEDMERIVAGLDGPGGSVLLTERNKAAVEVLERTLEQGKREIAIFYGAAHMMDIEKRMIEELGFRRTEKQWLVAWDMSGE